MKKELNKKLSGDLIFPSVSLFESYTEKGIDALVENESMKEIPVVKHLIAVAKLGITFRDYFFAQRLVTFIQEFNAGTIDSEKLNSFQERIESDKAFREKVIQHIILFNERFITNQKSKVSANLLKSWIEDKISWREFRDLHVCLDSLHPSSFDYLLKWSEFDFKTPNGADLRTVLFSRNPQSEAFLISSGLARITEGFDSKIELLEFGKLLFVHGIGPMTSE